MEQSRAKRRRDELYNNSIKYRESYTENGGFKKKNTAMVSSLDMRNNQATLKLPAKTQTFSASTKLFKPAKIKREVSDDADNDFKEPPTTTATRITPSLSSVTKLNRNPFAASSSGLVKPVINDSSDFRLPPKLRLPKKNKVQAETYDKKKQLLDKLQAHQKQQADDKDKKRCPFCSEIMFPMRKAIAEALEQIQKRDKEHEERELRMMEKENATSSFSFRMVAKRQVSTEEKDNFCSLHYRELVTKPEGFDKKYPTEIDFEVIAKRIKRFDSELRDIIRNKIGSDYRNIAEAAYKNLGVTKARSAMSVMLRFEQTLPGYYGPKGSSVILDALSDLYLKSGYLSKHLVSPQLPIEFIQQVLVPEAGFRLIRQDMIRAADHDIPADCTSKAKKIMIESCDYGSAMFPMDEPEIDELDVDKSLRVISDQDDEAEDMSDDGYY